MAAGRERKVQDGEQNSNENTSAFFIFISIKLNNSISRKHYLYLPLTIAFFEKHYLYPPNNSGFRKALSNSIVNEFILATVKKRCNMFMGCIFNSFYLKMLLKLRY